MTSYPITQSFIPGPRLIDGSDLNRLVAQANAGLQLVGDQTSATTVSTVGAATLTAASLVAGMILRSGGQSATAFTDTTDTAANIIAALPAGAPVGTTVLLSILNSTDAAETLAGGTGVTINGNAIIPAFTTGNYFLTFATSTTVTLTFMGGGAVVPLPPVNYSTASLAAVTTIQVAGLSSAYQNNLVITTSQLGGTQFLPPPGQLSASIPNFVAGLQIAASIRNTGTTTLQLGGLNSTTLSGLTTTIITGVTANMVIKFNTANDMTVFGMGKSATGT